jgi:2-oxoglutarate dehydrogenase E2 component (dihydrolipoamide succinyltransferase)
MPQLGEAVIEGTIAQWLKQQGDQVEQFEPLLEIETDKVTTEAMAESAGTLLKILIPAGETVEVGTVLAIIGEPGEEVDEAIDGVESASDVLPKTEVGPEPAKAVAHEAAITAGGLSPPSDSPGPAVDGGHIGRISPVVGRMAEEHNLDLNVISGTGRDGRITKKDVLAYLKTHDSGPDPASSPVMPVGASPTTVFKPGAAAIPGEIVQLTSIRRSIAEHMVRSKHTSPHVTTVFEVDFSKVSKHRQENKDRFARDGANLTFTTYIIAAIVQSLKAHPIVNSSWTKEGIQVKKEINIGMATAIEDGLIVPVIRNADSISLLGIARAVNDLSNRARLNKLSPDEVQAGSFTLTNHGVSGSLFATPIINQPQCGILGMGMIEKRVKVINDAIAIRLMAYASLTFDHRILDGATADGFMQTFQGIIEGWE